MIALGEPCTSTSSSQSQNVRVSFGMFRPGDGCNINDAVTHMTKVAAAIENSSNINVAILKCLDDSWAAVFIVWKGGSQNTDNSALNLPEAAVFTKGLKCAVRTIDSGWFQLSSQQTSQGVRFAQLSSGDIVSIRRIHCSWNRQEMLSYSCLAILRSYFNCLKGIISYSFYDSLDGKQIIGLGVWDGIESASAMGNILTQTLHCHTGKRLEQKSLSTMSAKLSTSPPQPPTKIPDQALEYSYEFRLVSGSSLAVLSGYFQCT